MYEKQRYGAKGRIVRNNKKSQYDIEKSPSDWISSKIRERSGSEDGTGSDIDITLSGTITITTAQNESSLSSITFHRNLDVVADEVAVSREDYSDDVKRPPWIQPKDFELKSNDSSRQRLDSIYGIGDSELRQCQTCIIKTDLLYDYSVKEELISIFKVSIWVLMSAVCGIGYEGRVTISKWFGILETTYIYPLGISVVAGAYSAFDIANESLHQKFYISQLIFGHSVSITACWLDILVFGNLFTGVLAICYIMVV